MLGSQAHMDDSTKKNDQTTLLGVVLAAALAVFIEPGEWDWTNCALGLTLLLILHAYDREQDTSWPKLFAFGAVFGMCCMVATGVFWERLLEIGNRPLPSPRYSCVNINDQSLCNVSTHIESRLEDYETALIWLIFGIIGTAWAGFKRGKTWFS